MNRSIGSKHSATERTTAASGRSRQDDRFYEIARDRFFGEKDLPSLVRDQDAIFLELFERYLGYVKGRPVR